MKTLLLGINSKFIHPNLAIRYLKSNCDFDVEIKEFTIKDSLENMFAYIVENQIQILGVSVYIWNVELVQALLARIHLQAPEIIVILGGPEVSYESDYFLEQKLANFIITNEGEIAFNRLLHSLFENLPCDSVPNLRYLRDGEVIATNTKEIASLNELKNPYIVDEEPYDHKIAYVELSRGCPYTCSYCLASLEKRVRYFDIERVTKDLSYLYNRGARTFKFLDRTFNIRESLSIDLFEHIFNTHYEEAVFQFEINADILSDNILQYLETNCPPNKIRFEIGIQSTNDHVNAAVYRKQDTSKLFHNIKRLKNSNVILHLDLIAGLPYEDLESFKRTFNSVFRLHGDELQLGFLKMLRGTRLFYEQDKYHYVVQDSAPYELISNQFISEAELMTIHIVEETLNIFWNKGFFNHSLPLIMQSVDSPFDFFHELGLFYLKEHVFHRYQLTDIYGILEQFVQEPELVFDIRKDYLNYHHVKPKIYWEKITNKNEVIRLFHSSHPEYNIDDLYKYSVVVPYHTGYLLTFYYPTKKEMHVI